MIEFDEQYWTNRYLSKNTGWDVKDITTPIKEYIDQLTNKKLKILVPGCGNGYEVIYLYNNGFSNVFVVDISANPLTQLQSKCPDLPKENFLHADFFGISGEYDLIIEQTFFCSLHPTRRAEYVHKMSDLLQANGKLVGLLFNIPLKSDEPPFGGNRMQYLPIFKEYLHVQVCEECYNSIPPRQGNELFIIAKKSTA